MFDLNQCNLNRCLVVGGGTQVGVSAMGTKRWLSGRVSFSCPYVLLLPAMGQRWVPKDRAISPKQNLPCSVCGCPTSRLTCWRCLGREDTKKKTATNAKHFADCTRVEIHRSTVITSILSPNLILCKVILELGIA